MADSEPMADGERKPVAVSRRIGACAHDIFRVLIDPARHTELDGSGMLRGAVTTAPISRVGDVFVMKMFYEPYGEYQMSNHVVDYEEDRRVGWEPRVGDGHPSAGTEDSGQEWGHRWSYEDGAVWIDAMSGTLERLDKMCTRRR